MRALWLIAALVLSACAATERHPSLRPEADLLCTAPTVVRSTARTDHAPMSLSIEVPARVEDEGRSQMCVEGACNRVILESQGRRGRSWTRYIIWSHEERSLSGPLEVHPGGRTFEATLRGVGFSATWRGRCAPGVLSLQPEGS